MTWLAGNDLPTWEELPDEDRGATLWAISRTYPENLHANPHYIHPKLTPLTPQERRWYAAETAKEKGKANNPRTFFENTPEKERDRLVATYSDALIPTGEHQ